MDKANSNNDKMSFEDLLSSYLRGELSEQDETNFVNLLKGNPAMKKKAIASACLVKAMQQVGGERDQKTIDSLKEMSRNDVLNIVGQVVNRKKTIPFKLNKLILPLSAAASILLCVWGGVQYYTYQQVISLGQEYITYFQPEERMLREEANSSEDTVRHQLESLSASIQSRKDLNQSISSLERIWAKANLDEYNEYTTFMPEIGWMLANAFLIDNEKDKAIGILEVLIEEYDDGTVLGEKARELLQRIKDI